MARATKTHKSSLVDAMLGGAISYLEGAPFVSNVRIGTTREKTSALALKTWTGAANAAALGHFGKNFNVTLPEDLLALMHVSDGFSMHWSVSTLSDGQPSDPQPDSNNKSVIGSIHINAIEAMARVNSNFKTRHCNPLAFLINDCHPYGKICLVYVLCATPCLSFSQSQDSSQSTLPPLDAAFSYSPVSTPTSLTPEIWFQARSTGAWYPLASTFTNFFRLAVLHLGIQGWPLVYALSWSPLLQDQHLALNLQRHQDLPFNQHVIQGVPQSVLDWIAFYSPICSKVGLSHRSKLYRDLILNRYQTEERNQADESISGYNKIATNHDSDSQQPNPEICNLETNSPESFEKAPFETTSPYARQSKPNYYANWVNWMSSTSDGDSRFDLDKVLSAVKMRKEGQGKAIAAVGILNPAGSGGSGSGSGNGSLEKI